ncbi:MAG TPA: ribosome silencing factor [Polyangia bacterium]|nr:ribosome silencing factor [Polyangia bacterium]
MKTTRRSAGAKGKKAQKGHEKKRATGPAGRKTASPRKAGQAGQARKAEPPRIPVRGARKTKVKARPIETPPPARGTADLAETRALAVAAMEAALEKRGVDPILIDVSAMGSYTDFIGVVSGRSNRQVDAIAEGIGLAMKARGLYPLGREGAGAGRWTLLDFGAFVVHVFYHPVREFYDLESLWIEAPRVKLDVPPEAALGQPDALYGAL